MRRLVCAVVSLIAAAPVLLAAADQDPPPIPGWHEDLKVGLAEARQTGRPLMVVFR